MNSQHNQPLGRLGGPFRPRFALGQTLRVINKTARIPLGTEVRVTYWLPLRRDGTYHYFVTGPLTAMAREGAWVHERDLEATSAAPSPTPSPSTTAPLPVLERTQMKLAALPEPTQMKLAPDNPLAASEGEAVRSRSEQTRSTEAGPGSPRDKERRKQWFRDWLSRGHLR